MNGFLIYSLKTALVLGLFILVYRVSFLEDTNFRLRRIYLVASLFISFLLPFVRFTFGNSFITLPTGILDEVTITSNGLSLISNKSGMALPELLRYIYLGVTIILTLKLILQLVRLKTTAFRQKAEKLDGITLYRLPESNISYSFFRNVFIGRTEGEEEFNRILDHEKVHAALLHSVDAIILELLACVFWFNPLIWWYRSEVRNVHEYEADTGALGNGHDIRSYQITLLEHLIGSASPHITNHFNHSIIKNRIAMMNKEKYPNKHIWKLLLIVPVAVLAMLTFSCTKNDNTREENQAANKKAAIQDEETFSIVEDMPKFNGGDPAVEFRKYISENLKYPEIALEKGISGRVIVQFTVNSEGKVVNARVLAGADPALDKEAIRVIMSSPTWTPGRQKGRAVNVLFTFPIKFSLDEEKKE